jgi:hypothetical protein
MTEFRDQDLSAAIFERVSLRDARFRRVDLTGAEMAGVKLHHVKMKNVELCDVEVSGDLQGVTINGVEIAPLLEAELNRRDPLRAKMRPKDADGFREAWGIVTQRWSETLDHARTFPEDALHESVDGEWSFIQTLRHLNFASAAWVARMILNDPSPWHPLDLPWDEAPHWEEIPRDREARPTLGEVLAVRRDRQAMVGRVIESLTDEQLASHVTCTAPGWPQLEDFPLRDCLLIVLNEEWEHRRYAERDLGELN